MTWAPSWRQLDRRWDEAEPYRFHVRFREADRADAPLIVLVHGLGVSSRYLAPTALALHHRGFHVEAPDLPGYGPSPSRTALDLRGLADGLRTWLRVAHPGRRPVLLANSFGCQIVADVAARDPDAAVGLVLVGPTVDRRARSLTSQLVRWVRNAPREPTVLGAIIAVDYAQCGFVKPTVAFRSALTEPIEDHLAASGMPVLLVRGANDPIAPRRWLHELAEAAPRARLLELADVAHTANFTAPQELAEATAMFTHEVIASS